MPPESRGSPGTMPSGMYSKSTPNLPTLQSLKSNVPILRAPEPPSARRIDPAFQAASGLSERSSTVENARPRHSEDADAEFDGNALEDDDDDSASQSEGEEENEVPSVGAASKSQPTASNREALLPAAPWPRLVHHSRSHTYLGPAAFAPPFYNRPPTPLPPSPSLTSLLRPNFSQHSQTATPDPSSDEAGASAAGIGTRQTSLSGARSDAPSHSSGTTDIVPGSQTPLTAAAASTLTSSFLTAKPIPRASPKVPTYEYYGFTLYLTSGFAFVIYLFWSFLPSPLLHQLGMHYYPNRWWSLAIPAWLVVAVVWIYVALAGYNTQHLTLRLDDPECLVDEAAMVAVLDAGDTDDEQHAGHGVGVSRAQQKGTIKGRRRPRKAPAGSTENGAADSNEHVGDDPVMMDWAALWNEGTDAVMDIPIGGVCQVLYGSSSASDDDDHDDDDDN